MLAALESEGYADGVRAHLNAEGTAESWSDFLSENTDTEILTALIPEVKGDGSTDGIAYDVKLWTFVPDFESIDGLDDLEFADLARLLPILSRLETDYESKGILPPIPGALVLSVKSYTPPSGSVEFAWDPDNGTLSHRTSSRSAMIGVDVRSGDVRLSIPPATERPTRYDVEWIALELLNNGTPFVARMPADAGGATCRLWVDAAQGQIELG